MVLFSTNLIIWNQLIDAVKVIEDHGSHYKHDKLWYANILKLYSIVFLKERTYDSAVKQIDKAIVVFTRIGSASGLSLWYLLKAYLSLDNIDESSSWSNSEAHENHSENQGDNFKLNIKLYLLIIYRKQKMTWSFWWMNSELWRYWI